MINLTSPKLYVNDYFNHAKLKNKKYHFIIVQ